MVAVLASCTNKTQKKDEVANPDLDSIQQWIEIAKKSKELPLEDRTFYLKKAEEKTMNQKNDTIRAEQLSKVSLEYYKLKDSLNFRRSNKNLLKSAQKIKDQKMEGFAYWDLGEYLMTYGILDSAYFNYRNALRSFEQLPVDNNSKSLKARMYYNMGKVQDSYKDYLGAEISITSALKIFDELGDEERINNCYNVLGSIANGRNDSEQALYYYGKIEDYLEKQDELMNKDLVWSIQNNIGSTLMDKEDYNEAEKVYENLLSDQDLLNKKPKLYAKATSSLASIILKKDKDYPKVEQLLNEAKAITIESNDTYSLARINQFYAELLAEKGDTAQAIEKAMESFSIAKETYNNDRSLNALRFLTNIDTKDAVQYANEYYSLNEKIQQEENAKRDKFARISWETDQVIEENQLLTEERKMWIGLIFGFIVFGVAFVSIVMLYINNNRLKFKQKQQESNQEIYNLMLSQQGKFEEGKRLEQKRISEELHDGILGEMLGTRLILSGLNERQDEASVEQRSDLIEKLRGIEEEIRTISHELNSAAYEKFHNFIVSLDDMIHGVEQSSGMDISLTYDEEVSWDKLLGDIKINAYRIVQEALKNCVKHAESKNVFISFQSAGDNLKLTIVDDGVGFDTKKGRRGIGLRNIISRTKKIKGKLDIDSTKGKGTTITITFPAKYISTDIPKQKQAINA